MTLIDEPAAPPAPGSAGGVGRPQPPDPSMLREVGQSFYLMGLMAAILGLFLGLGLLAVWILG